MSHDHREEGAARQSRMRWVFYGFLVIAAFFLLTEHTAHVFGVLPYLLLLACPLMHIFGHHGHGNKHRQDSSAAENKGPASSRPES
jgi:DUF2933 family protein